ncbi:hypothetical protein D3C81_1175890 [compost metagenome]
MNLDRYLADADLARNLLVEQPGHGQRHDLGLARRQRLVVGAQRLHLPHPQAPNPVFVERGGHRVEQVLVADRLGQEVLGAGLHRRHGHRNVAVAGHEDDGDVDAHLGQPGLEVEPARPAQPHIEHQAARHVRHGVVEQFGGRGEQRHPHAHRAEQVAQAAAQHRVIVDDQHQCVVVRAVVSGLQALRCHVFSPCPRGWSRVSVADYIEGNHTPRRPQRTRHRAFQHSPWAHAIHTIGLVGQTRRSRHHVIRKHDWPRVAGAMPPRADS